MDEWDEKGETIKKEDLTILLEENPEDFFKRLVSKIKANSKEKVQYLLSLVEKSISTTKGKKLFVKRVKQYREGEDKGETLLHIAVKYMDDSNEVVIDKILQICPELLTVSRDKHYKGQTPLHIAITKGAFLITKCLLSFSKSKSIKSITKKRATGRIFTNTVMMGELPLHVAALTFKESIVDLLLENGAKMHRQNGCGDTVFHSLVKYSAVYPNKADNVIKMFTYLNKKMRKQNKNHEPHQDQDTDIFLKRDLFVWSLENQDCLTPLQLSAKLGVVEIFQFIINLKNVYSFDSSHDGLFDVKLYDITEIDTVANHHIASITNADQSDGKKKKVSHNVVGISHKSVETNTDCNPVKCSQFNYPKTESILEMMFGYDYHSQAAFRIIETIPVKNIILEKWNKLKYIYFIWGFLHLVITVFITVELVIRSDLYALQSASNTTKLDIHIHESSRKFANIVSWISLILGGAVYSLMILLLLIAKARRPNALRYIFHNLGYLLFLIVFSVCLFIDFFMTRTKDTHNNIALIVAVIAGWWFSVFFLRAFLLFSFFTELIRRVIVGDLLRFAVIISFMLFAFTAGIYAAFVGEVGSEQNTSKYQEAVTEHFDSFGGAMLTMFKLMLGLDDFGVLNEARIPGLAITLYIVFALLTYVLLMNSLIAMMSQTCAVVLENRYPQWRLQQLSVGLFLEDLFCLSCIRHVFGSTGIEKEIRGFDPITQEVKEYNRYFLQIHSLQTTYATEEDREAMKNMVKEKDQIKTEALRSDKEIFKYISKFKEWYECILTNRGNQISNESQFSINDDKDGEVQRENSIKKSKRLSRVSEEKATLQQSSTNKSFRTDLSKSEKQHHNNRRGNLSENMHERGTRKGVSVASASSESVLLNGPLTPVDHILDIHPYPDDCPE